ncbi:MAG: hypothetical protein ACOYOT_07760 [Bacteroidales bacterium]
MSQIKGFLSERNRWDFRSGQIVFEWEDIIAERLQYKIYFAKQIHHTIIRKLYRLKLRNIVLLLDSLRPIKNYTLYFKMTASTELLLCNLKHIIPVIIDFWLSKDDLPEFYKTHANCRFLFISSKEVYDFLKENNCPLTIYHLPLSLPDHYISEERIHSEKKIDFLFAGRVNPTFWEYVLKYEKQHPQIEYVYQELRDKTPVYISNKRGELKEDYFSRENYTKLLAEAKFAFYITPGIDPAKKGANGFNQVTPRFLELISSGNVVLGQYPKNSDTDYYEMEKYCLQINNYNEFAKTVDKFLNDDIRKNHLTNYQEYLRNHSTTFSCDLLKNILNKDLIG